MAELAREGERAVDLHIGHAHKVFDAVLHTHGLAVAGHVGESDGARVQVCGVACVDHRAVAAQHAGAGQAGAAAIDGLPVADGGLGRFGGVANNCVAASTKYGHAAILRQAHGV